MHNIKMSYSMRSVVKLTDEAVSHLIDVFARIKSGEIPNDAAPPGFVAAIEKLQDHASTDLILSTIIGEVTGIILIENMPRFYPRPELGFDVQINSVEYQETPPVLAPPAEVTPLVVHTGTRTLH